MAKAPILTPQATDFPRWYQDVVAKAELAENGPVRGTMVIRPWGYAIWERLQRELDDRIKAAGADNAYFPLFIPESFLRKEAEHVEGFSPELAVVTHGGGKQLEEPVVVRPTSETVFNVYFAKWVQSYRDLPLLLNQWANVVRWELRPRLFLRTTEFLWQEGHTCHASEADARAYTLRILREVYADVMEKILGPLIMGHGDDAGLRLPPRLAPTQVVVLVVKDEEGAGARAATIATLLREHGVRTELDDRVDTSFGRRAVDWEIKGVPVRIELGPRDLANGEVTVSRRDLNEKTTVALDVAPARVAEVLADSQSRLYAEALSRRES